MKNPTSNIQHPKKSQPPNSNKRRGSGGWKLVIVASLELGCWCLVLLAFAGCRRDMFNQPFSKPLERSDFFADNQMASRPLPAYTVARGQLNEDEAFYTGKIGTNLVETFPFRV